MLSYHNHQEYLELEQVLPYLVHVVTCDMTFIGELIDWSCL